MHDDRQESSKNTLPPMARAGSKEWRLIEAVFKDIVMEKRRSRRWGVFFKLLLFIYLFALLFTGLGYLDKKHMGGGFGKPHTAIINIKGEISADTAASAYYINQALKEAFRARNVKAVILHINSPGGSPVQSDYVYNMISTLKKQRPLKVYAVISDIGASGAYYLASAADQIYANKLSLVGSIGVISSGFGFVDSLKKIGATRRVYTAGAHKAFLDPFQPPRPAEIAFWENNLKITHKQFIENVAKGRGDRLEKNNPDLFSGLIWTGIQAKKLGLIDDFGDVDYVARHVVGQENTVDYTKGPSEFEQLAGRLGLSVAQGAFNSLGVYSQLR